MHLGWYMWVCKCKNLMACATFCKVLTTTKHWSKWDVSLSQLASWCYGCLHHCCQRGLTCCQRGLTWAQISLRWTILSSSHGWTTAISSAQVVARHNTPGLAIYFTTCRLMMWYATECTACAIKLIDSQLSLPHETTIIIKGKRTD